MRSPKSSLTEDGKWLCVRAKSMSEYYQHTKKEDIWDENEGNEAKENQIKSQLGLQIFFLKIL